jgi:hypothetical protein
MSNEAGLYLDFHYIEDNLWFKEPGRGALDLLDSHDASDSNGGRNGR